LTTPSWNEYRLGVRRRRHRAVARDSDRLQFTPVNTNLLGYNIGGAVGFLNEQLGLRFDLRYFRSLKQSFDPG
jgi:hypothetical protein